LFTRSALQRAWNGFSSGSPLKPGCAPGKIALRVSDIDLENFSVEVSKAIWGGEEDSPKTEAGNRSICISNELGAALKEYLAGSADGFLFQFLHG
jgi:integrase